MDAAIINSVRSGMLWPAAAHREAAILSRPFACRCVFAVVHVGSKFNWRTWMHLVLAETTRNSVWCQLYSVAGTRTDGRGPRIPFAAARWATTRRLGLGLAYTTALMYVVVSTLLPLLLIVFEFFCKATLNGGFMSVSCTSNTASHQQNFTFCMKPLGVKPLGTVSHALETVWNPYWDTNRVSPCKYAIKPYNERERLWDPWAYETVQWNYALRETSISYQSFTSWKPDTVVCVCDAPKCMPIVTIRLLLSFLCGGKKSPVTLHGLCFGLPRLHFWISQPEGPYKNACLNEHCRLPTTTRPGETWCSVFQEIYLARHGGCRKHFVLHSPRRMATK
jgi:hypothetical protein